MEPMRHTIVFCLCFFGIAALTGCHGSSVTSASEVRVIVEGGERFPAALAGHWKADRDGWEFVLDAEGRIVSTVLSLGRVSVAPGRKAILPTRTGGESLFEPGAWTVHYSPDTQQLTLKIVMDHIRVDMGGTILEGKTTDTFSGTVSLADSVWQAQWTAFNDYSIRTPDGRTKDLSTDPTYGETKALTFQKLP
jgi:hypothetical protein